MSLPWTSAQKGDIDTLTLKRSGFRLCSKLFAKARDLVFNFRADFIYLTAKLRAIFRRQRTDTFLFGGDQPRLSAEILIAQRAEVIRAGNASNVFCELLAKFCQPFIHTRLAGEAGSKCPCLARFPIVAPN